MQRGAVEAFKCQREIEDMRAIYEQRRNMFVGILNSIPGVHCTLPEGAFYAWVHYDVKGMDSAAICEYLLEKARVVGMPGTAYGEYDVPSMRFSFANATDELETAANRIKEAILALYK
jgi:aspartate aminotransferase